MMSELRATGKYSAFLAFSVRCISWVYVGSVRGRACVLLVEKRVWMVHDLYRHAYINFPILCHYLVTYITIIHTRVGRTYYVQSNQHSHATPSFSHIGFPYSIMHSRKVAYIIPIHTSVYNISISMPSSHQIMRPYRRPTDCAAAASDTCISDSKTKLLLSSTRNHTYITYIHT